MLKILIADDHAIVRAGLRALLKAEPEMELVGEATGGQEAVDLAASLAPDVLVLDIGLPDLNGIRVIRAVRDQCPDLHIVILTVHEDEALLREAIKMGASGYVLKHAAEAELISAIHTVVRGELYVDPAMVRVLLGNQPSPAAPWRETVDPLTNREKETLRLIAQGYTNRQIGELLGISARTVEGHRANLSEKLALHTRVELVRYAREHGLID